ncbi:V-type proton ATPase subunit a, vacuolar isoform [Monosporozyma unispora]|nr:H(+)-transporting V0 sector ATPase subunit a [Kazachstania unispora]
MSEHKEEAIFRSAEMSLLQFYIPQEISREAVYTMGKEGNVQFRDLNSKVRSFQRSYVNEIRRLDNVQRQYRYFYTLLENHNINLLETEDLLDVNSIEPPTTSTVDDHVENAEILEKRLVQMEDAMEQIKLQKTDLEQFRYVLQAGDQFFNAKIDAMPSGENHSLGRRDSIDFEAATAGQRSVSYVTGVIPRDKIASLEQILWRVLRGNLLFSHIEINDPVYDSNSKKYVAKNAFIIFSHGDLILDRIRKIAESLDAKLYNVDKSNQRRSHQLIDVNKSLGDLYTVLETTTTTLESELIAISGELNNWFQTVCKEKHVFETLNKFNFDANRKTLIAEGWVPKVEIANLQDCLNKMTSNLGLDVPSIIQVLETNKVPPTFHRTNKFTLAFQNICDSYGIAQYREVNAGLPTIVTFPFMFAIMFGDIGHGFLMTLAGLMLVLNEEKISKMKRGEIFDMAYIGRYIVLLMGVFSMYTGFLYNDIFSMTMTLFKSGWKWPESWNEGDPIAATQVGVYPIGLDSAWHGTENALLFSNSYKMKLSVLMGFIHMTYSYMFSLVNHLYFSSVIDIVANFIPGLIFMQGIFGYLSICIVYKWSVDWVKDEKPAPALLNMLINMFLSPGVVDEELYPHQAKVQVVLLVLALICVPWLLVLKPLHFKLSQKNNIALPAHDDIEHAATSGQDEILQSNNDIDEIYDDEAEDGEEGAGHDEEFGDVIIHQVIHTIEFCLNCVSHTASYLRLWALSLAHAQLSSVLWSMTIGISFGVHGLGGVLMTVFLFAMWFVLTVCILVVMEGTSAMLHSLRLHWVESMSKFFVGDGIEYLPFEFTYQDLPLAAAATSTKTSN